MKDYVVHVYITLISFKDNILIDACTQEWWV